MAEVYLALKYDEDGWYEPTAHRAFSTLEKAQAWIATRVTDKRLRWRLKNDGLFLDGAWERGDWIVRRFELDPPS